MSKPNQYVLVLWAVGFDEAAATIIVTELRQVGHHVKIISMTRQQTRGAHGIALVPDLTLHQALPLLPQTNHLLIPANRSQLHRLSNDPSLIQFLEQTRCHQIPIRLQPGGDDALPLDDDPPAVNATLPLEAAALIEFVRALSLEPC